MDGHFFARGDIGNMSIQASRGRIRSSENLPIYMTISVFSVLVRMKEKTQSSFDVVDSQSIFEILDSTFCSQRFSVKKSFCTLLHLR